MSGCPRAEWHPRTDGPRCVHPSSTDGHTACPHFLATVNKAAEKVGVGNISHRPGFPFFCCSNLLRWEGQTGRSSSAASGTSEKRMQFCAEMKGCEPVTTIQERQTGLAPRSTRSSPLQSHGPLLERRLPMASGQGTRVSPLLDISARDLPSVPHSLFPRIPTQVQVQAIPYRRSARCLLTLGARGQLGGER